VAASEGERSALTDNSKQQSPVKPSPALDSSLAADLGRLAGDSCQLTSTSCATIHHHQQHQQPQPYLSSCWLSHVAPTDFIDAQTRRS